MRVLKLHFSTQIECKRDPLSFHLSANVHLLMYLNTTFFPLWNEYERCFMRKREWTQSSLSAHEGGLFSHLPSFVVTATRHPLKILIWYSLLYYDDITPCIANSSSRKESATKFQTQRIMLEVVYKINLLENTMEPTKSSKSHCVTMLLVKVRLFSDDSSICSLFIVYCWSIIIDYRHFCTICYIEPLAH